MSWNIVAILIGITCFLFSNYILKMQNMKKRITYIILGPFLLSVVLYWCVSIIEGISSQTGGWFVIAVVPWTVIGFISLLAGMLVVSVYKGQLVGRG